MFACIVPQALDVIKHYYSPARFSHTFLTLLGVTVKVVLTAENTISPVILDEKLTNFGKKTYRAEFFRIDAKYSQGQHTKSPQKSPRWQIRK